MLWVVGWGVVGCGFGGCGFGVGGLGVGGLRVWGLGVNWGLGDCGEELNALFLLYPSLQA